MSNTTFFKLLNKLEIEAPHITDITLSGMGEPFFDPQIVDKAWHAKNKGYRVYILSNGSKADPERIYTLFKNKLDSIRFSVHSLHEDYYDHITQTKNNFHKSLSNIEFALSIKSHFNTKIIISSDITEDHIEDVEKLRARFARRADLLEIWRPHNWVNWAGYRSGKLFKTTCGRPFNGPLQIQVDGTINMCCFDYNGDLLLGDFNTQSLEEIFSSEMYQKIVEAHSDKEKMKQSNLICKQCDQLYEKDESIMLYNSKFDKSKRIEKVSTTYKGLE
jgi:radical SAM protein with 4Fe4S-binding SPASM domain